MPTTQNAAPEGLAATATPNRQPSLLSPADYDADAVSIRSDQDSDSEDDELQLRARNSRELRAHDRLVFMEEDETDKLVTSARREQDRGRRRGSNLSMVAHPLALLGIRPSSSGSIRPSSRGSTSGSIRPFSRGSGTGSIRPFSRGSASRSRSPDASMTTNATTLRASSSTEHLNSQQEGKDADRRRARRERRKERKQRLLAQARDGEDGELMFEMEEGGFKDGSSTGDSSDREGHDDDDDAEDGGLLGVSRRRKQKDSSKGGCGRWAFVFALIGIVFVLLAVGAWRMTVASKSQQQTQQQQPTQQSQSHGHVAANGVRTLMSNGTALFGPTTLIISLDGFRADFLTRGLTPRLNAFVKEGVSPLYMRPSFPSVTFPNHYTLATGLYPESHGIVGNTFWDPALQAEFHYTDPSRSLDPKWWGGEPFWVTAERAGARTAIHMWPGSEAHILGLEPSYVDKYNGDEKLAKKVARILEFLDQPGLETAAADDVDGSRVPNLRPQLIAAYVPNVDADGHRYGPNSTEIRGTIAAADAMLNDIFAGLAARNLTHIVNVIVVSDHGMATTDVSRLMQLDDLVGDGDSNGNGDGYSMDRLAHVDGWPLVGLRPRNESDSELQALHAAVRSRTANNPNVEVYLRDVDMPERYHFAHNPRIAPLWLVPKTGWNIVPRAEFDIAEAKANNLVYHPRGLHGYDHEHPLMRAIFVARGPAFPHAPNSKLGPFQNINVYNMLCDSIGVEPKANNGTLRLPLTPVGLHDETIEEPADPVPPYTMEATETETETTKTKTSMETTSTSMTTKTPMAETSTETTSTSMTTETPMAETSMAIDTMPTLETMPTTPTTPTPTSTTPTPSATPSSLPEEVDKAVHHFWGWLTDKIGTAWDKLKDTVEEAEDDADDEGKSSFEEGY